MPFPMGTDNSPCGEGLLAFRWRAIARHSAGGAEERKDRQPECRDGAPPGPEANLGLGLPNSTRALMKEIIKK